MHLALLGTGMIVKEVLPVLEMVDGIVLEAILSTPRSIETAEQLAERYSIPQATSDYQEVLANKAVDTIYIATPNHTHYDYAKEALKVGKHVICEKPFTMTSRELEELTEIAKAQGCFLFEAITNQYLANFYVMKEHLDDIGDIKIVTCNYSQYSSRYDAFKRGEIAPVFNPEMGGGALRDLNIYNIHLLVGLFGKPQSVNYLANVERGIDTSGVLLMDFKDFKAVSIGAKDSSAEVRSTIQGTKGSITLLGPSNSMPEVYLTLNGQPAQNLTIKDSHHRMYQEFVAFQKMMAQNDHTAATKALDHSRQVMAVLDQAVTNF